MARADGFAALMVRIETKDRFNDVKCKVEEHLGLTELGTALTSSQMVEWMCNKIMSDITFKGESK